MTMGSLFFQPLLCCGPWVGSLATEGHGSWQAALSKNCFPWVPISALSSPLLDVELGQILAAGIPHCLFFDFLNLTLTFINSLLINCSY